MRNLVRVFLLGIVGATAMASAGDQAAARPEAQSPPVVPATPAPPAAPAGDIQDFIPSEKVGADDAVAFPVDI